MLFKLNRLTTTRLYTLGELSINGQRTTQTVEDTLYMLDSGIYSIRLLKNKARRREITILPNEQAKPQGSLLHHFAYNGSHISACKNRSICIGEPLIPGALKKGQKIYERIFDRIEKAEARKEPIVLIISDSEAINRPPIRFWEESSKHSH